MIAAALLRERYCFIAHPRELLKIYIQTLLVHALYWLIAFGKSKGCAADSIVMNNSASSNGAACIVARHRVGEVDDTAFLNAPLAGANDHFGNSVATQIRRKG